MECSICTEDFEETELKRPFTLSPCGHCFCMGCLNRLTLNRCPECRRFIEQKTLNRGLLSLIEKNKATSTKMPKLFDTLLNEVDDLKAQLKQSLDKKLKDNKTSIDQKRENMTKETQTKKTELECKKNELQCQINEVECKMNELLNAQNKSNEKFNLEEKNFGIIANSRAKYEFVVEETEQFKNGISQFSIAELFENSNNLKDMIKEKIDKLAKINRTISSNIEKANTSSVASSQPTSQNQDALPLTTQLNAKNSFASVLTSTPFQGDSTQNHATSTN
jgi:hypothetical protein